MPTEHAPDDGEPETEVPEPVTDDAPDAPDAPFTDDAPEAGPPPGDHSSSLPVVLAVVAAVFAVASVALLLLFLGARGDKDELNAQLKVRTTASRFVEAFVALDTQGARPDDDATITELGTGSIIAQHQQAMAALRKLYAASGAVTARGSVTSTYLAQLDKSATEASVLVTVDLVVTGQGQGTPFEHYLEVHLVKVGGTWKVDNVSDINTQLAAGGGQVTPTTATTVPATSTASSSG